MSEAITVQDPQPIIGKTKMLCPFAPGMLRMISTDNVTRFDTESIVVPGKGKCANKITYNFFKVFEANEIRTHLRSEYDDTSLIVDEAVMLEVEAIYRWRVAGSYLKRHPEASEGDNLEDAEGNPLFECNFKGEYKGIMDPLGIWNEKTKRLDLYHPAKPVSKDNCLGSLSADDCFIPRTNEEMEIVKAKTKKVGVVMKNTLAPERIDNWDGKIEFGLKKTDLKNGILKITEEKLLVCDVMDPDSLRAIYKKDKTSKGEQRSKQMYRDWKGPITDEFKEELLNKVYIFWEGVSERCAAAATA